MIINSNSEHQRTVNHPILFSMPVN